MALSTFLFISVNALKLQTGTGGIWELLYAADLIIMKRTEDLQRRLIERPNSMERRTETNGKCKEGKRYNNLKQVERLKCLEGIISKERGAEGDVRDRIKKGWAKWRVVNCIIMDEKMPTRQT